VKEEAMTTLARYALALVVVGASAATALAGGRPAPGVLLGGDGVSGPSGAVRYVTTAKAGVTTVTAVRVRDGRVLKSASIDGAYGIPLVANDGSTGGISADGKTLVLGQAGAPQAASRFAVVSTKRLELRRVITLRGSFAFDAISPRGVTVYLIQFASPNGPDYNVRALDLRTGRLVPGAIVDKRERESDMQGIPATRVSTRDGGWAYTLYAGSGRKKPFVHALDTRHAKAVCIDIPWRGRQDRLWRIRLALRRDQLLLRTARKTLFAIDTKTYRVSRR
jgi:hypothetical protein